MDITYNTNYFKGFDPAKELARKDWRARFCDYCDYCLASSRGTIWCDLKLNGWIAHKTFDRTKGPAKPFSCFLFRPTKAFAVLATKMLLCLPTYFHTI